MDSRARLLSTEIDIYSELVGIMVRNKSHYPPIYKPAERPRLTIIDKQTVKGEEIYMSYGPHSNDFLLVEC
jgi:hypothetical protein